jgi:hypothetical protein
MIRVVRPKPPASFEAEVRAPGRKALLGPRDRELPPYWRKALPALQRAFDSRCGYSAMLDRSGTVDHFVPRAAARTLAYEWSNLRYASHWINASKGDQLDVLDPFEIEDDWFEILLPSLQLVATKRVPPSMRARVQSCLEKLPIRDDERVVRQRRAWLHEYDQGLISLEALRAYAPLIATAVEKRDTSRQARKAPRDPGSVTQRTRARRSR